MNEKCEKKRIKKKKKTNEDTPSSLLAGLEHPMH